MSMTAEDLLVEQAPVIALTANDRCDRDGAQAYTGWAFGPDVIEGEPVTLRMLLCGHHTTEHAEALQAQDFIMVVDERDKLLVQRESSADA